MAHIETVVSGDVSRYYYRDCSCGWQGPPRESIADACEDHCPANQPAPRPEAPR